MIDQIWSKMTEQNLNDIDSITSIVINAAELRGVTTEYESLFPEEREGTVSLKELEDYFGASIELTEEEIVGGFKFETF